MPSETKPFFATLTLDTAISVLYDSYKRFLIMQKQNVILGIIVIALFLSIPVTLFFLRNQQEERGRAAASTTLSFSPTSSATAPLQTSIGQTIPVDIMVDPGSNIVTFIRFQVNFDPTKLALVTPNPFTLNTSAIPTLVEGPVTTNGSIAASVSIGSDPTKAIQKPTKVSTILFKALASTQGSPTMITFGSQSETLSAASSDQAEENVLSTTQPAAITITDQGGVNPSISASPSGSPAPTAATTTISFTLLLHGVGNAGDNSNPDNSSFSNKNPLHPQRTINVQVYNSNNQLIASTSGSVIYNQNSGAFLGQVDLGANFPSGNYNIKVKTDRYLRKLVPGIIAIKQLQDNPLPPTQMVAGDVNGDNTLNVLDYNALLDCGFGDISPLPMQDPNSTANSPACQVHTPTQNVDLDDNGIIDSTDYNLFLRELAVQNGD